MVEVDNLLADLDTGTHVLCRSWYTPQCWLLCLPSPRRGDMHWAATSVRHHCHINRRHKRRPAASAVTRDDPTGQVSFPNNPGVTRPRVQPLPPRWARLARGLRGRTPAVGFSRLARPATVPEPELSPEPVAQGVYRHAPERRGMRHMRHAVRQLLWQIQQEVRREDRDEKRRREPAARTSRTASAYHCVLGLRQARQKATRRTEKVLPA